MFVGQCLHSSSKCFGYHHWVQGGVGLCSDSLCPVQRGQEEFPEEVTLELRSEVRESVNLVMKEERRNVRYTYSLVEKMAGRGTGRKPV